MTAKEINQNFVKTITYWNNAIDHYSEEQFALNPDKESWSVGQVCQHLIMSANRVFSLIDKCMEGSQNENERKTDAGEKSHAQKAFPDIKIKVPLSVQVTPEQPVNKARIKKEFESIKNHFEKISEEVRINKNTGKEKHVVLGYLNAIEWLQTIEMHFRHHLRQKERIDEFLGLTVSK